MVDVSYNIITYGRRWFIRPLSNHFRTLSTKTYDRDNKDAVIMDVLITCEIKPGRLRIVLQPGPVAARKCIIVYVRLHHSTASLAGV